jgi:hypothetical protein
MSRFKLLDTHLRSIWGPDPADMFGREVTRDYMDQAYDLGRRKGVASVQDRLLAAKPDEHVAIGNIQAHVRVNDEKHVAVDKGYFFNPNMAACPRNVKVQLLGEGMVASYGIYKGEAFWIGWAPAPDIPPSLKGR